MIQWIHDKTEYRTYSGGEWGEKDAGEFQWDF